MDWRLDLPWLATKPVVRWPGSLARWIPGTDITDWAVKKEIKGLNRVKL
jgi:hypothetical protein